MKHADARERSSPFNASAPLIFIMKVTALYVAKVIYNAVIFNKDAYVDLTTRNRI